LFYYKIFLLKSSAVALSSLLEIGVLISVPLKSTVKTAVVMQEVEKPKFQTEEIIYIIKTTYSLEHMEIAKFVSEVISLSLPCPIGCSNSQHLKIKDIILL